MSEDEMKSLLDEYIKATGNPWPITAHMSNEKMKEALREGIRTGLPFGHDVDYPEDAIF